jgi:hypothetical protein
MDVNKEKANNNPLENKTRIREIDDDNGGLHE